MDASRDARGGTRHWPAEIRLKSAEKALEIDFDDGRQFRYPAELLRVESPSAEVMGHGPGQRVIVAGRRHVGIQGLDPVGNYAILIRFDDHHDTGIYTWNYLYALGEEQHERWQSYLDALRDRGFSRDP
jgi:DUF971 family protein